VLFNLLVGCLHLLVAHRLFGEHVPPLAKRAIAASKVNTFI
jgi:hypothetical protein